MMILCIATNIITITIANKNLKKLKALRKHQYQLSGVSLEDYTNIIEDTINKSHY